MAPSVRGERCVAVRTSYLPIYICTANRTLRAETTTNERQTNTGSPLGARRGPGSGGEGRRARRSPSARPVPTRNSHLATPNRTHAVPYTARFWGVGGYVIVISEPGLGPVPGTSDANHYSIDTVPSISMMCGARGVPRRATQPSVWFASEWQALCGGCACAQCRAQRALDMVDWNLDGAAMDLKFVPGVTRTGLDVDAKRCTKGGCTSTYELRSVRRRGRGRRRIEKQCSLRGRRRDRERGRGQDRT